MLLQDKNAIVYGGGGLIGGAIARAFAREGARVFLAGRTRAPLDAVAAEIAAAGGLAETARVDALDEESVDAHVDAVVKRAGSLDIAVNAVGIRGELQGTPLVRISQEEYAAPIVAGTMAHFLTGRAAGRHMVEQGSGAILMISATATWSKAALRTPIPMGGFGVACAAVEGLARSLASELGPHGVRVVCLRLEGTAELLAAVVQNQAGQGQGADVARSEDLDWTRAADLKALLEGDSLLRRLPTIAEVAEAAAIMASDRASGLTGIITNVSCGAVVD
jgi:3-oxoacyl-[acyl-carrier protein] reductase